jgi:hypothetical protein
MDDGASMASQAGMVGSSGLGGLIFSEIFYPSGARDIG